MQQEGGFSCRGRISFNLKPLGSSNLFFAVVCLWFRLIFPFVRTLLLYVWVSVVVDLVFYRVCVKEWILKFPGMEAFEFDFCENLSHFKRENWIAGSCCRLFLSLQPTISHLSPWAVMMLILLGDFSVPHRGWACFKYVGIHRIQGTHSQLECIYAFLVFVIRDPMDVNWANLAYVCDPRSCTMLENKNSLQIKIPCLVLMFSDIEFEW